MNVSATTLGPGWVVTPAAEGGVDLQVAGRGRVWVIGAASTLAACWIGAASFDLASHQPMPMGTSVAGAAIVGALLAAFAAWCAVGSERWHVAPNCFEHRVGIGRWQHVRRFHDAELVIIGRFNKWGQPYYRLCCDAAGRRHLLIERGLSELGALADLICRETGWRRHDEVGGFTVTP